VIEQKLIFDKVAGEKMLTILLRIAAIYLVNSREVSLTSHQYDRFSQTSTFTYAVEAGSILNWVLGLESCPEISPLSSIPATPLTLALDVQTQISGVKWYGNSESYSITLSGHVQKGSCSYGIVQGAYKSTTGVVDCPVCSYYADVVCNAGGPYSAVCHNNQLSVHLLGHASKNAVAYAWDHFIPEAQLLTPNNVASVLTLPTNICMERYRVSLTVTGHDPSDTQTCVGYVFVEDSISPTFHNIYERDISAQPHDVPVPMILTAEDDCDSNVEIKFTEQRVDDPHHPCAFKLHRIWVAKDDCGNPAVHTQIISVIDTEPPTLSGVDSGGDYECNNVPPPCTVEGNDYNDVSVEIKEFKTDGPCDCQYTLVRKWIATDCAGNMASESQRIRVTDDRPPEIFGVPQDATVECDNIPSVPEPSAVDECCGATISFIDSKHPSTCIHEYTITRTWIARDSCGNSDSKSQKIFVEDTEAPVLSGVNEDITVQCDQVPLPCEVEAQDNCDSYVAVTFAKNTELSTCEHEYEITYSWNAEDICGNPSAIVQVVYVIDNEVPIFGGLPPHSMTVDCDSLPVFHVTARDNCDYDVTVNDTESVDQTYDHDYVSTKEWTATDACGNTARYEAEITVQDNEDPVIIGVPDDIHTSCESVPVIAEVEATDNCCEDYSLEAAPSERTIDGTCNDNYILVRTWSVQDCSHNVKHQSQSITVEDLQAPVLHGLPGFEVVKCENVPEVANVEASDNCDDTISVDFTRETETGSCKTQYKELRTWTSIDRCGNGVSYTQTIVTYDDEPPILSNIPDDVTVECEYIYPNTAPDVNDTCDAYIQPVYTQDKIKGTCEYDLTFYRHWTVEDDCGNQASAGQTITVEDVSPPYWTWIPSEMETAEYPDEPTPPVPTAADKCEYAPDISFNERKLQFGYVCAKAYRLVRAWFVVDTCGNMGPPIYQHVVIDDTAAPTFISEPEDATVECDDIPPPFPVHAVDHYEEITVTMKETTNYGTCNHDYDIERTWSAIDSCGNQNETRQLIVVTDVTAPTMYSVPPDESVECDYPPPATITAEDNCDGYLEVVMVAEEEVESSCRYLEPKKTIYRSWRATDNCGNSKEVKQTVTIYDTKAPYFLAYEQDTTVECDQVPAVPTVSYHDDCDTNPTGYFQLEDGPEPSCADAQTILWTWEVVDECAHTATWQQTVTVIDTTPPVLTGYWEDALEVECDSVPANTGMSATDNCDQDVEVTFSEAKVDPFYACKDQYILFWTWTAKDDCGNTASYTKTVTVKDSILPVLSCNQSYCSEYEGDFEVECEEDFLNWELVVTATDNCDENVKITETHVTEHGTCEDSYTRIDTYIAEDNCGNKVDYVRSILVVDTTPPTWSGSIPNATRRVPYNGDISCPTSDLESEDRCDDDVTISCMSSITNGICEQDYTKTCTCTAVDDCGNSVEFVQIIDVFDNEAPEIVNVSTRTVECLTYLTPPSDPEIKWGYGGVGSLYVQQRTIPDNCTYIVVYTWTATDDCRLHDTMQHTVHVVDLHPPVIWNVPEDETAECHPGAPVDYLTGEDNCDGKVLVVFDKEEINVEGPYCYTLVRSWTAVDHCGLITVETQTIVVDDKEPPTVSYPPTHITTDCHSLPLATADDVHVEDNCEAHRNVSFTDVKDPGTCECEWTQHREWVVCDSCGNCVTVTQTVSVTDNIPPVLSVLPVDITVQTGEDPYPVDVYGVDTYGSDTEVKFFETRVNSTYSENSQWVYLLIRNWITEDECKNQVSHTQTITVIDTIPVKVMGVPKDTTIQCIPLSDIDVQLNIYSSDYILSAIQTHVQNIPGEVGNIEVTLEVDDTNPGTCENEYVWIRCWQTTDHSGNTDEQCFTITVVDNEPPQFDKFPDVEYAECVPALVVVGEVTASDNCVCGATVSFEVFDYTNGAYSGYITREWVASDCCGHTVSHSQTVWVADTQPPQFDDLPSDKTLDCADAIPVYDMTATDECHNDTTVIKVSWKEVICEGEYIIFYSWRAIDDEGNWVSHNLQISVTDTTPPVLYAGDFGSYIENNAEPVTGSLVHKAGVEECPWKEVYHSVYAKDECSEYPWDVPVKNIDRWGTDCQQYVAYYWQTADDCGNPVEFSQTISVQDTLAPQLSGCPIGNETLHCNTPMNNPYIAVTDHCDPEVEIIRKEKVIPGSCEYDYQIEILWTAKDRCGYQDSCSQTITYEDIEAPSVVLHALGNMTVPCDQVYDEPSVSATDDCTNYFSLNYDQSQKDGTCPCEYVIHRVWTYIDECGKSTEVTQTVSVEDNVPPELSVKPKDSTVPCPHAPIPPPVTATDNCCEVTVNFNGGEKVNGSCLWNYMQVYSWTATDECGFTDVHEMTVTVIDVDGPEFTLGEFVTDFLKVECDGIPEQLDLEAYDICEGGLKVIPHEGKHQGSCEDFYSLHRTWDASDDCGNGVHLDQVIQVFDTTPPVLILPEAGSYECNFIPTSENHNVAASDNCDSDPHVQFQSTILGADCTDNWSVMMMWLANDRCGNSAVFSMVVPVDDTLYPKLINVPDDVTEECFLPAVPHVTAEDECDKLLTPKFEQEIPYEDCVYHYSVIRRWIVTDRCQNSVEKEQHIVVVDDGPPTFSDVPDDETIGCKDHVVPPKVTAEDKCEVLVPVTVTQDVVPGSCPYQYITIVTWTAEDKCGNVVIASQTVSVHDNVPPEISEAPGTVTAECDNIPRPPHMFSNDDCSYGIAIKYEEFTATGSCDNDFELVRVWTAVDECGNKDSKTATVAVSDSDEPTFVGTKPVNVNVPCYDVPPFKSYDAVDNCEGYVTIESDENRINGTCPYEYRLERYYKAEDVCGNYDEMVYTVSVFDYDDPELVYTPADDTEECDTYSEHPEVTAKDSCGYGPSVDFTETKIVPDDDCPRVYLMLRTWTVTDDCDRTDVHVQTLTKEDTTPPVINEHEDITAEIGNIPPPWNCTWTDNCDEDGESVFDRQKVDGSCDYQYDLVYTCVATDCTGNEATSQHVIHVYDFTPPVIVGVEPDTTVEYQKVPLPKHALKGVRATDNSDGDGYETQVDLQDDVKIPGYDANDYTLIRTYTSTDACDNIATVHRTIKVVDRTPPCFDEEPEDVTVECDAIPVPCEIFTVGEANDLIVDFYENKPAQQYVSEIERVWTACDHSGNCNAYRQTITVVDSTPPVFTREPENIELSCDCEGFPAIANLAAIDNCDNFVKVSHVEDEVDVDCPDNYTIIRTWTAEDHHGRSQIVVQSIEVRDKEDPVLVGVPASFTVECHDITSDIWPKVTTYDNCDDDVKRVKWGKSTTLVKDHCSIQTLFEYEVADDCGHNAYDSFNVTMEDTTPPSVVGGKHCIYNTSQDGYGSRHLYKKYLLKELISASDTCDSWHVSGVWFNRTKNDESQNLVLNTNPNSWDQNSYRFSTTPGGKYTFSFEAKALVDSAQGAYDVLDSEDKSLLSKLKGKEDVAKEIAPSGTHEWQSYQTFFIASSVSTILQFDKGVGDYIEFRKPVIRTFRGEGYWGITGEISNKKPLNCEDSKAMDNLANECGVVEYMPRQSTTMRMGLETFEIINVGKRDDRYCFVSQTRPWRTMTHIMLDNAAYWVITNYAPENPSSYSWLTLENEVTKMKRRESAPDDILNGLKNRGTINDWWAEKKSNSPVDDAVSVTCPDITVITSGQCQAACYYSNKAYAVLYSAGSFQHQGECHCASRCDEGLELPDARQHEYTMFKWFEGFFFDRESNEVWILAYTDTADHTINLWVEVEDRCGNSATAKVEFWISPSLETAAAKGRACDHSDADIGMYSRPFAFTSDDKISPAEWTSPTPSSTASGSPSCDPCTKIDGSFAHCIIWFLGSCEGAHQLAIACDESAFSYGWCFQSA